MSYYRYGFKGPRSLKEQGWEHCACGHWCHPDFVTDKSMQTGEYICEDCRWKNRLRNFLSFFLGKRIREDVMKDGKWMTIVKNCGFTNKAIHFAKFIFVKRTDAMYVVVKSKIPTKDVLTTEEYIKLCTENMDELTTIITVPEKVFG